MNIVDRARNIITQPRTEWNVIAAEIPDAGKIVTGYVFPLAGLAAVAAFIGNAWIGTSVLGIRYAGFNWGIYHALDVLVSAFVSVYLTAFITDLLAPSFGSEKNFNRSIQLVAYSFTPAWVGGLLAIIPVLAFIGALFGLYGLYLLYLGLPPLKKTPADKHVAYFVVILIATICVYIVIGWIMTNILMGMLGLSYGTPFTTMP